MWRFIIAAVLAAAGFGVLYLNWKGARLARAAKSWPKVRGTVTQSDFTAQAGDSSDGSTDTVYALNLAYEYEYQGVRHVGHDIEVRPEAHQGSPASAEKRLAPYPVGAEIDVMVNPANPDQAVLVAHAPMQILFPVLFLGLAAAVALGVFGG